VAAAERAHHDDRFGLFASDERAIGLATIQASATLAACESYATCDARSHATRELPDWRSTDVS
jgi:hypothetical protein